jgi:hypothetical protein
MVLSRSIPLIHGLGTTLKKCTLHQLSEPRSSYTIAFSLKWAGKDFLVVRGRREWQHFLAYEGTLCRIDGRIDTRGIARITPTEIFSKIPSYRELQNHAAI